MKKYVVATLVCAFALIGAVSLSAQDATNFRVITPAADTVLRGGTTITVTWDVKLSKTITQNPFGETEFLLQTAEGIDMRITPELSPNARSFTWTVPAINTRTARLVYKAGVAGEGDQYLLPMAGTFSIRTRQIDPIILLNYMRGELKGGSSLPVTWTSNMAVGTSYDVMVSYDRGAHFTKAGTTAERHFSLPVDEDFRGAITIQIVARTPNGIKVSSFLTRDATVRITDGIDADDQ